MALKRKATLAIAMMLMAMLVGALADASPHDDDNDDDGEGDDISETIIQGYVYCQTCRNTWSRSLQGARVGVVCKDNDDNVRALGHDYTDHSGFYQIKLPGFDAKEHGVGGCKVYLISSRDYNCRHVTNVGDGKNGASLTFLSTNYHQTFYKSGPFAAKVDCPYKQH